MKQKLSNEHIFDVLSSSSNLLHKSIISFLFTTGLKHNMIRNLKIKDLLSSCGEYMADDESIDDLLNKNPFDIVPCWRISNDSKVGIAFNTPETTKYIFDYLKDRKKYVNLTEESYLFKNYAKNKTPVVDEKPLNKDFITRELGRKKKELNSSHDGDEILFNVDSIEYTFAKICDKCLLVDDYDKKELIALFQANATTENKFYNKEVKQYYLYLMQYLTIDSSYASYNNVANDNEDAEDNYDDSELVIKQKINLYYMNNIKKGHKVDYEEYDRLCGAVYDLALFYRDCKYHTFILNDDALDVYFKKAKAKILIEDYTGDICIVVNQNTVNIKISEIKQVITKMGIPYIVNIEDKHLDNVLKEYLTHHTHDYGEVVVTPSVITNIVYMCIDGFCMN